MWTGDRATPALLYPSRRLPLVNAEDVSCVANWCERALNSSVRVQAAADFTGFAPLLTCKAWPLVPSDGDLRCGRGYEFIRQASVLS